MNVKISFSKENKKEGNASKLIKEKIENYINFILFDYLDKNMTEKDLEELKKLNDLFSELGQQTDLENILNETENAENFSIENILNQINEENEYLMGKKSIPLSKNLNF